MIHHKVTQGTDAWLNLRAGIPTASSFHRIITPKTLKLSAQADDYMNWLLAEWILGMPIEGPQTEWMERGQQMEDEAVKFYALERDAEPKGAGFFTTDDGMIGASPDRLVGEDGLLEIKCPAPQTHVAYMRGHGVDEKYVTQLQGQLWVSERAWVDIQSYAPGFPTVIVRVERDEQYIAALSKQVRIFADAMVQARVNLTQKFGDFKPVVRRRPDALGISEADIDAIIAGGQ